MITALKPIPSSSSPSPDGIGSSFYVSCLDIFKEDLLEAATDFFSIGYLPKFYTSSYVVLIQNVKDSSIFDKFRPISLCAVVYKIFSKIIANKLTGCLNCIISLEQGAFLPARSIFDNITMAQEMAHTINRKTRGGNIILKIDMAKAYDVVDWKFINWVLHSFGF